MAQPSWQQTVSAAEGRAIEENVDPGRMRQWLQVHPHLPLGHGLALTHAATNQGTAGSGTTQRGALLGNVYAHDSRWSGECGAPREQRMRTCSNSL